MPELPEVENIRKQLSNVIIGHKIATVYVKTPKVIHSDTHLFKKRLTSAKIISIKRKGKNLIIDLSNSFFLIIHLRMTGQILLSKAPLTNDKHIHLVIKFKRSSFYLIYRDTRKFGYFKLVSREKLKEFLEKIGPDALGISYTQFKKIIFSHKRRIKSLLLDQHIIAGIGNIYCDELLFRAGIHPERNSSYFKEKETKKLYLSMKKILKVAIDKGGSSVTNYLRPDSTEGSFQRFHQVYRRGGEVCFKCSRRVKRIEVAQRGTYFCPHCQK